MLGVCLRPAATARVGCEPPSRIAPDILGHGPPPCSGNARIHHGRHPLVRGVRRHLPLDRRRPRTGGACVPWRQQPAGALARTAALHDPRNRVRAGTQLPHDVGRLARRHRAPREAALRGHREAPVFRFRSRRTPRPPSAVCNAVARVVRAVADAGAWHASAGTRFGPCRPHTVLWRYRRSAAAVAPRCGCLLPRRVCPREEPGHVGCARTEIA